LDGEVSQIVRNDKACPSGDGCCQYVAILRVVSHLRHQGRVALYHRAWKRPSDLLDKAVG